MSADSAPQRPTARLSELELVEPADVAEWHDWLVANHATSPGIWLAVGKKGGTRTTLTYELAVQEAVAFGWIDSTVNRLDDHRFRQLFTPRKPTSNWSRSNKERVARLTEQGRMQPAGLAAVAVAQSNGSWELLDRVDDLVMPDDLTAALAAEKHAAAGFAALSESQRKIALYWVLSAKRPETRARRIAETVRAAAEGKPPR